jgi:hypothetical protein
MGLRGRENLLLKVLSCRLCLDVEMQSVDHLIGKLLHVVLRIELS